MAGILRLTPMTPEVIRVSFVKGVTTEIKDTYWKPEATDVFSWSVRESKTALKVSTEKVSAVIDKKTGAIQFETADGTVLLKERSVEPRLIMDQQTWEFLNGILRKRLMQREFFLRICSCCVQRQSIFLLEESLCGCLLFYPGRGMGLG